MPANPGHADCSVALVWDESVTAYDFGPGHPLAPIRVELTHALIHACDLVDAKIREVTPRPAESDLLARVHDRAYVDAVRSLSVDPVAANGAVFGLGAGDTPAFTGMHDVALKVCAATVEAARQVLDGTVTHAFNPAGGLHHAMPARAAGFCVYNDPAVAIDWLLGHGVERVCYVDVDVHHGDGVEVIFADDPRVLTISLHESGRYLFPGTGAADDIGGPGALGSAVNVPLHPGTDGAVWLAAFDRVVEPLVRAFAPDVLVTQLGCDTHATDPLAHLALTVDDMAQIYARLHTLAHDVTDGRWIATGGGGYQLVEVVPRAWTLAFAEMTGRPLPVETPFSWRELVEQRTSARPPTAFTDDPVRLSDAMRGQARDEADRAVAAVQELLFPRHGISR